MEFEEDKTTENESLWIYERMTYTEDKKENKMKVASLSYKSNDTFHMEMFAGDHFCKLLSPFKAMEWIHVDSLYANYSLKAEAGEAIDAHEKNQPLRTMF